MDLTVNSKGIASFHALPVQLIPILGAYELTFPYSGIVHELSDGYSRWLTIDYAQVKLRTKAGHIVTLGAAYSDKAIAIRQSEHPGRSNFALKMVLMPHQLELIEGLRDGGNLAFTLLVEMRGSDSQRFPNEWPEQIEVQAPVEQSHWIAQLNAAQADRVLLFEVRVPPDGNPLSRHPAQTHLLRAVQLLQEGNWRQCVAECRQFAEALGGDQLNVVLNKLKTDRKEMTKADREMLLLSALQQYGHLAAHSESQLGTLDFDRNDAKLALSVAAAIAGHHFSPS